MAALPTDVVAAISTAEDKRTLEQARIVLDNADKIRVSGREISAVISADIFNALNTVIIYGVSTTATFNTPAGMALQNNQYTSDGNINPSASSRRAPDWAPRPAPSRCAIYNCSSSSTSSSSSRSSSPGCKQARGSISGRALYFGLSETLSV